MSTATAAGGGRSAGPCCTRSRVLADKLPQPKGREGGWGERKGRGGGGATFCRNDTYTDDQAWASGGGCETRKSFSPAAWITTCSSHNMSCKRRSASVTCWGQACPKARKHKRQPIKIEQFEGIRPSGRIQAIRPSSLCHYMNTGYF